MVCVLHWYTRHLAFFRSICIWHFIKPHYLSSFYTAGHYSIRSNFRKASLLHVLITVLKKKTNYKVMQAQYIKYRNGKESALVSPSTVWVQYKTWLQALQSPPTKHPYKAGGHVCSGFPSLAAVVEKLLFRGSQMPGLCRLLGANGGTQAMSPGEDYEGNETVTATECEGHKGQWVTASPGTSGKQEGYHLVQTLETPADNQMPGWHQVDLVCTWLQKPAVSKAQLLHLWTE